MNDGAVYGRMALPGQASRVRLLRGVEPDGGETPVVMGCVTRLAGRVSGLVLLAVALAACGVPARGPITAPTTTPAATEERGDDGGYWHLAPPELEAMLRDKDFMLINTHAPYEVEIAGTDAHIPMDASGEWLGKYPTDRSAKVVLYCRSGRWSTLAARELVVAGYRNIYHLDGGMVAWGAAGFPLWDR